MNEPQNLICETCGFAKLRHPITTMDGEPDAKDYKCAIKEVPPDFGNCPKWKPKDEQKQ